MTPERRNRPALVLGCLGALAFGTLAFCTPWGVGISPDSVVYIGGARSLLAGSGFGLPTGSGDLAPITHYPPLYSVSIAAVGTMGFDLLEGARWLNATLFAANVVLAGFLVLVSTGSLSLSVIASLLMMTPFPLVQAHSMAWSEPLFLFLGLLGIVLLVEGFARQNRRMLLIAATTLGLSVLARYVGVAFLTAGVVGILLRGSGAWRAKIRDATIFFAVGLLPFGLWIARNFSAAGTATNRSLGYNPPVAGHLNAVFDTASTWLLSTAVGSRARIAVFLMLLVLAACAFLVRRRRMVNENQPTSRGRPATLAWLCAIVAVNYILVVLASVAFVDAQIPIDNRILSPLYVALMLLSLCALAGLATRNSSRPTKRSIVFAPVLLVAGLQLNDSAPWLALTYREGVGYASKVWKDSELVKQLRALSPAIPVASNAPDVIYTLAGRPARMIPRKINTDSNRPNEMYVDEFAGMKKWLRDEKGVLAYFDRVHWRWYLPSEKEISEDAGFQLVARAADGAIYRVESKK